MEMEQWRLVAQVLETLLICYACLIYILPLLWVCVEDNFNNYLKDSVLQGQYGRCLSTPALSGNRTQAMYAIPVFLAVTLKNFKKKQVS